MNIDDIDIENYLTNKRFQFSKTETEQAILKMKDSGMKSHLFDKIEEEDFILSLKYKTYKRNFRKIIFALISILLGVLLIIFKLDNISFFLIFFWNIHLC